MMQNSSHEIYIWVFHEWLHTCICPCEICIDPHVIPSFILIPLYERFPSSPHPLIALSWKSTRPLRPCLEMEQTPSGLRLTDETSFPLLLYVTLTRSKRSISSVGGIHCSLMMSSSCSIEVITTLPGGSIVLFECSQTQKLYFVR